MIWPGVDMMDPDIRQVMGEVVINMDGEVMDIGEAMDIEEVMDIVNAIGGELEGSMDVGGEARRDVAHTIDSEISLIG